MKFGCGCSQQILISFFWVAIHLRDATDTCYLPNGSVATGDIPCSASSSICCPASNGICLSNGLCFIPSDNVVARSSCTDQSWGTSCTSFCKTANTGVFCQLLPCGGNLFCCGLGPPAETCCSAGAGFPVATGSPSLPTQTVTSVATSMVTQTQADGGIFTSTEIISTITTISTTATASTTTTSSSNGASSTTAGGGTYIGSQCNNPGASTSSCPNCSTKEIAIGAGVGIPLAAALLCSLILLFLQVKRGKHRTDATDAPAMIQHYPVLSQPMAVGGYGSGGGYAPGGYPPGGYAPGGNQYDQYQQGYVRPRDPRASDPIPVSPRSRPSVDGNARYELSDQLRHGSPSPPTYLSIPK